MSRNKNQKNICETCGIIRARYTFEGNTIGISCNQHRKTRQSNNITVPNAQDEEGGGVVVVDTNDHLVFQKPLSYVYMTNDIVNNTSYVNIENKDSLTNPSPDNLVELNII